MIYRTCFCCDVKLEIDWDIVPKESSNYLDATCWTSYGSWCSNAFDGIVDPDFLKLEIIICDECLKKKIDTAYGWENVKEYGEPLDLGEIMENKNLKGKTIPLLKSQKCGKFRKYGKKPTIEEEIGLIKQYVKSYERLVQQGNKYQKAYAKEQIKEYQKIIKDLKKNGRK